MLRAHVSRAKSFGGVVRVPGDKSLSHRAVLFTRACGGTTEIVGLADGDDVACSLEAVRRLGVRVERRGALVHLEAEPFPAGELSLDCGNSGTTARLLLGSLAAVPGVDATLFGDASLSRRPMKRVAEPIGAMRGRITLSASGTLPARVVGGTLVGAKHVLPVASAQVKSALLLAGVRAEGETWVQEPGPSRDHTERWLPEFGVEVLRGPDGVGVRGGPPDAGFRRLFVPGDPSSAAFFAVAAAVLPGARVELPGVSLNPTRFGVFEGLRRAGAGISVAPDEVAAEPSGTVVVESGELRGFELDAATDPGLIDELPVLAVCAAVAPGLTRVAGAAELRVKESDRIEAIATGLRAMGARIEVRPDGFEIEGGRPLRGATIRAGLDHRIAMAFAIAGLVADGTTVIEGAEWVSTSFPGFWEALAAAGADVRLETIGD